MDDLHPAVVDDAITGARHPDAQVEVVAIHEEGLVKQTNPVEHLAPGHHEGPVDRTDVVGAILGPVRQVVAGKQGRPWKRRREAGRTAKPIPERRDRAPACQVHRAVPLHQLW